MFEDTLFWDSELTRKRHHNSVRLHTAIIIGLGRPSELDDAHCQPKLRLMLTCIWELR